MGYVTWGAHRRGNILGCRQVVRGSLFLSFTHSELCTSGAIWKRYTLACLGQCGRSSPVQHTSQHLCRLLKSLEVWKNPPSGLPQLARPWCSAIPGELGKLDWGRTAPKSQLSPRHLSSCHPEDVTADKHAAFLLMALSVGFHQYEPPRNHRILHMHPTTGCSTSYVQVMMAKSSWIRPGELPCVHAISLGEWRGLCPSTLGYDG